MLFLREGTARDIEKLTEIENTVIESGQILGENLQKSFKSKNSFCYIAEEQIEPQGYLLGAITTAGGKKRGHLKVLVVKPDARQKGIGRRLIEEFENQMILKEIDTVYLEILEEEQSLVSLFLRLGYEVIGRFVDRFGPDRNALRMVKVFYFMKNADSEQL